MPLTLIGIVILPLAVLTSAARRQHGYRGVFELHGHSFDGAQALDLLLRPQSTPAGAEA